MKLQTRRGLPVLLSFILAPSLFSQTQFVKTLSASTTTHSYALIQTLDGNYVTAGGVWGVGAGLYDVFITKLDSSGDYQWTTILGGQDTENATSVIQTADGGYVTAGQTRSFGEGGYDVLLVKFDSAGNHQWTRAVGGEGDDCAYSLAQASDGGYVIAGYTTSFGVEGSDVLLIKLDSLWNHQWAKTLGGSNYETARSVIQTTNLGYAIAGETRSFGAGVQDVLLAKFDSSGTHQWTRTLGGEEDDDAQSLIQTEDGEYIIAARTHGFGASTGDILLAKFDSSGGHQWAKIIGGENSDIALSIIHTSDSEYAIAGWTHSFGTGPADILFAKFDTAGDCRWASILGGEDNDYARALIQTVDGGYAIAGYTKSFGADGDNILLARFDSSGGSCLGDSVSLVVVPIFPSVNTITPSVNAVSPTIYETSPTISDTVPTITTVCVGPAVLECSLWAEPDTAIIEQNINLYTRVENTGWADADSVVPQIAPFGDGSVGLVTGPIPSYANIEIGADTVFSWLYTAEDTHWVHWKGYVSGRDHNNGRVVSSSEDTSSNVLIQTSPNIVFLSNSVEPDTLTQGQISGYTLLVKNTGEAWLRLIPQTIFKYSNADGDTVRTYLMDSVLVPGLTDSVALSFDTVRVPFDMVAGCWSSEIGFDGIGRNGYSYFSHLTADTVTIIERLTFIRGDANTDGELAMSDAVFALKYLYVPGSAEPTCMDAADTNDDGDILMGDAIYTLKYLYVPGSPEPPAPFPDCGVDITSDTLGCISHPCSGGKAAVTKREKIRGGKLVLDEPQIGVEEVVVSVHLNNKVGLAGFAYRIEYDPSVFDSTSVQFDSLIVRSFDFFSAKPGKDKITIGNVVSLTMKKSLPPGEYHVADITFHLTAQDLNRTELRLVDVELVDTEANALSCEILNATIDRWLHLRMPKIFALRQAFPNPFAGATSIRYQLPKASHVELKIYNSAGQLVSTLIDKEQKPGYYSVEWNGKDAAGMKVASGVYFYRIEMEEFTSTKKMILLR